MELIQQLFQRQKGRRAQGGGSIVITMSPPSPYVHHCWDMYVLYYSACMQAYNAKDEIEAAAKYPMVRLFTASLNYSTTPQAELLGVEQAWARASPSECVHTY